MAAQARREIPHRGGEAAARGDGLGQAAGDPEGAPQGAEGAPPGRLEVDRHRRHLALWRLRLQPRRHPHRPGRQPQLPRRQGVGQARVQGPRRHRRARRAQHAHRAPPPAPLRPPGRGRGARSRHHHPGDGEQGLPRRQAAPGAQERRQGAALPRRRRLHGLAYRAGRGAVLGGPGRVQAFRAFLFPQLPLRARLEGEPPALGRDDADARRHPHLPFRLPGRVRRRRLDESLRDRHARRLGRALERRGRAGLGRAAAQPLPQGGVAQSGAAEALGLHPVDRPPAPALRRAHVPADDRGHRQRHARARALMSAELPLSYRQNPRPIGFEVSYRLIGDRLSVDTGRKESEVALARVEQVRLTYETRSMGQGAYQASLTLADGTTVKLSSISWRSMIDARRQDAEYSAFVQALLLAVARANPAARFLAGKPRLQWLAIAAIAAVSLVAVAFFIWRAVLSGATVAALLGAVIAAAGIWQLEPMVRLNRPRAFTIRELPQGLLP